MNTQKLVILVLVFQFFFIPLFSQNNFVLHVTGNGDITNIIFSGDYNGEETPSFDIGPYDSPFTISLEVTNASGTIYHDNGAIESYSFDGFYVAGMRVPDSIITVDESSPGVSVEVRYYRESTTPGPSTPIPTPVPTNITTCQPAYSLAYGYVTDQDTNEPINGATINVDASLGTTQTISDDQGYYSMYVRTCMSGEPATFTVTAPGYQELSLITGVTMSTHIDFALALSSAPTPESTQPPNQTCGAAKSIQVTGIVIDKDTGWLLNNATITVQGNIGTKTTTSLEDGSYSINMPVCGPGSSVTFTVTRSGYDDVVLTMQIDDSQTMNLYMTQYCPVQGDVNGDGVIDIIDALQEAQYYVGIGNIEWLCAADVNCDGSLDIIDALLIAQFYVELIDHFSC